MISTRTVSFYDADDPRVTNLVDTLCVVDPLEQSRFTSASGALVGADMCAMTENATGLAILTLGAIIDPKISAVWVRPDLRGEGYGTALVQALVEECLWRYEKVPCIEVPGSPLRRIPGWLQSLHTDGKVIVLDGLGNSPELVW
jgi:GNAT superfamily N-acetyltransferase